MDFSKIPYAKIRMYEGTPTRVDTVVASYNVSAEQQYSGKRAVIMGKLYKVNDEWKFQAIGDPTQDKSLFDTITRIVKSYTMNTPSETVNRNSGSQQVLSAKTNNPTGTGNGSSASRQ